MASYRFCRSDDIPLLVDAHNECYRVHDPAIPEWTVDDFKQAIRDLDLWTSSCMVAREGKQTIGVLLAAKRETANLVYRIGIRPGFQRRGHGGHLLHSLGAKLAILGPRTMRAEIAEANAAARGLFEAGGYRVARRFADFTRPASPAPQPPSGLLVPVTLDDLEQSGALETAAHRCWSRADESLRRRAAEVRGWAVVSGERVEAYLLYHDRAGTAREILAFGTADRERAATLLQLLFRKACSGTDSIVRVRGVSEEQIGFDLLQAWGFERGPTILGYETQARPA